MNPLIQFRKSIALCLVVLALACFTISPMAQAVIPAPDGGYPGNNTAEGTQALQSRTTGIQNTALGFQALYSNTTGNYNSAEGFHALFMNTNGDYNTATGVSALVTNANGILNTAIGFEALYRNDATRNTATGAGALHNNTAGDENTATGVSALYSNSAGSQNTANGANALVSNSAGDRNTAIGYQALQFNTSASNNSAVGYQALFHNNTGTHNTACGVNALSNNTTGGFNIALGDHAGANLTIGSNNIEIGHPGFAGEHNTIRIGNIAQARTFITGVYAVNEGVPALPVYVSSGGQLGTQPPPSARRFKKQIKPMDMASQAILALKPVTFHYKSDKTNTPQFGLIAEEVAAVNPDLVVRDKDGEIYTVRYDAVNAMLLNEFLKAHRKMQEQEASISQLRSTVAKQEAIIAQQQKGMEAVTARLDDQDSKIQKVSVQLETSKFATGRIRGGGSAPHVVLNNQ
jgi:uncharacterized coiled-coil protein SlyX